MYVMMTKAGSTLFSCHGNAVRGKGQETTKELSFSKSLNLFFYTKTLIASAYMSLSYTGYYMMPETQTP